MERNLDVINEELDKEYEKLTKETGEVGLKIVGKIVDLEREIESY